jgi:APA family basic amino acid/polyamine antiporter
MTELKKTISFRRGMGLAICMIIGTGILALPGLALDVGTVHEAILGWFLIAIVAVPLIAICSSLGLRFPSTSGLAGLLRRQWDPGEDMRFPTLSEALSFSGFLRLPL